MIKSDVIYNDIDEKNPIMNNKAKATGFWIYCTVFASIGSAFQFGYQITIFNAPYLVIEGFFKQVYKERWGVDMSDTYFTVLWALTNGLMPLGGMLGAISSGNVADKFGRKNGLMLTNILVFVVGILNVISKYIGCYETLIAGRFIVGIYCGLFVGILPIYLMEVTANNLKGLAGSMIGICISMGIFSASFLALPEVFGTNELWPLIAGFIFIPGLFNLALIEASESPKWLYINCNDKLGAERSLKKLRGPYGLELVKSELQEYEDAMNTAVIEQTETIRWRDFFNLKLFRPLLVAAVLNASQQLSGINAVSFYSAKMFSNAGLKGNWPTYCTVIVSFAQFLMAFFVMGFIDKLGRKAIMLISLIGMGLSCFGLAIFGIVLDYTADKAWNYAIVACVVVFICSFGAGSGSIPNLITVELFDSDARSKANSIACMVNWGSNFLVVVSFPFINGAIGLNTFFIFGGLLVAFTLFVLIFMPETKNRTIDEIKLIFSERYLY